MQHDAGAQSQGERRWEKRRPTVTGAVFRERGRTRTEVEVLDLSRLGCRVRLSDPLVLGKDAWITLPSLQSWYCSLAWIDGSEAGLEFAEPLHPAVADTVVQRAQPDLPNWL